MALINCPECGKEISDKAISCPNCGYPLTGIVNESGATETKEYDVILMKYTGSNKIELIREIRILLKNSIADAKDMVDNAPCVLLRKISFENIEGLKKEFYELSKTITVKSCENEKDTNENIVAQNEMISSVIYEQENAPKCPHCNSTNIRKVSDVRRITHAAFFGIFSKTAFSQFECNHCGYKW